jgi:hypothetical protein
MVSTAACSFSDRHSTKYVRLSFIYVLLPLHDAYPEINTDRLNSYSVTLSWRAEEPTVSAKGIAAETVAQDITREAHRASVQEARKVLSSSMQNACV